MGVDFRPCMAFALFVRSVRRPLSVARPEVWIAISSSESKRHGKGVIGGNTNPSYLKRAKTLRPYNLQALERDDASSPFHESQTWIFRARSYPIWKDVYTHLCQGIDILSRASVFPCDQLIC